MLHNVYRALKQRGSLSCKKSQRITTDLLCMQTQVVQSYTCQPSRSARVLQSCLTQHTHCGQNVGPFVRNRCIYVGSDYTLYIQLYLSNLYQQSGMHVVFLLNINFQKWILRVIYEKLGAILFNGLAFIEHTCIHIGIIRLL